MTIAVTRLIPQIGIDFLKDHGVKILLHKGDAPPTRAQLKTLLAKADGAITLLTETIDEDILKGAPNLKVIANYAVGFDNIDREAAKKHGIIVTNTPVPEMACAVAEHTIALMLALARRIVESDTFTRKGLYRAWGPELLLGTQMSGKTLGIIGAGRIGSQVANAAHHGLGMKIMYTGPHTIPELKESTHARHTSLKMLLKTADVISIHAPLTPETRHLISTPEFALMKPTALLINTARGPIVHEKALLLALSKKIIAGAALDVFECEPAIDCDIRDNLELKKLANVILTPHTASATIEARNAMSLCAAKNAYAVLSGKKPLNPVN